MTASKIIRLRKQGYKIWRIAELCKCSENDVAEVLVDAGFYSIQAIESVVFYERKPDRQTIRKRVNRMREVRKKINQKRRVEERSKVTDRDWKGWHKAFFESVEKE